MQHLIVKAVTALNTIKQHDKHWPTNDQLRNNRTGTTVPTSTLPQPAPGTLPYGLGNTLNTPGSTKTRDGAMQVLATLHTTWAGHTPGTITYTRLCDNLIKLVPHKLPKDRTPEQTTRRLTRLAEQTEQICGYGHDQTPYICPYCTTRLYRPYTQAGLLDVYICRDGHPWTIPGLIQQAATMSNDHLVTQSEASDILGIKLGTIHARVKRRSLTPVEGNRYRLTDLS